METSPMNPLGYIINRQYEGDSNIKNNLFSERLAKARNLYRKDLLAHYGCVNAIEFSNEGELLVSGGDDRRVLLWLVAETMYGKGSPVSMSTNHLSNIFCVSFDSQNTKIFSGGNDDMVLIHDIHTTNLIAKLAHRKPVYGLHVNPSTDKVFATAGDDGRILLFDIRESTSKDIQCLAKQKTGFHSVMFNPTNPRFLVTSNSEEGIALWDCRKPREVLIQYDNSSGKISGISACFNAAGDRVLALRRRLPPVLYATQNEKALCQFYHPQYYNSCTMKTCCFAGGGDEYVLSGSDDFNLYMWRVPEENSEWGLNHIVLKGHRSIVNQVRYNKHNNLIASSGVEKMVKLWSTLPIGTWKGSILKEHVDPIRSVYSHEDYMHLVGHSGERISHDYSDQSTQEDAKMMAFFDSLIQREIEGWNSSSEDDQTVMSSDSDGSDDVNIFKTIISQCQRNGFVLDDNKKHNSNNNKSNRIAQLIFRKRNRLAKMAHEKSSSSVIRNQLKAKRKLNKHKSIGKHKSNGILNKKGGSTSSSSTSTNNNTTSTSKHQTKHHFLKQKYLIRHKNSHMTDQHNSSKNKNVNNKFNLSPSSSSLDAPSTSTGITNSTNSVYRVIEQDSDEEGAAANQNNCDDVQQQNANGDGSVDNQAEDNFVNILPTPLNGTHDMYINVLEVANGGAGSGASSSNSNSSTSATASQPEDDLNCTASTSNNSQSCACLSDQNNNSSENSDYEFDTYRTPIKRARKRNASDSGCGTGPGSSSHYKKHKSGSSTSSSSRQQRERHHQESCSSNNNGYHNNDSSDEDYNYEKCRKRIKKAAVVRKRLTVDSDSN